MPRLLQPVESAMLGPVGRLGGYAANAAQPIVIPGVGDIIDALAARLIPLRTASILCAQQGVLISQQGGQYALLGEQEVADYVRYWKPVLDAAYDWPGYPDMLSLYFRGLATDQDLLAQMRRAKMPERWAQAMVQTRNPIPPVSDLLRYVVRDVFDQDARTRFGYSDEFSAVRDAVGQFAQAYGYTIPWDVPGYPDSKGLPFTWLLAEWQAHWQLPSAGQGYEMVHRLRLVNDEPRDPSGEVFSQDDLETLLKTLDYPPYWREKLLAISYKPLQIRTVQTMARAGIITGNDVVQYLQDGGYNQRDAELLATYLINANRLTQVQTERRNGQRQVVAAYSQGLLEHDDAAVQFYRLTLETRDQLVSFDATTPAERLVLARADRLTMLALANADLKLAATDLRAGISAIRKVYVARRIDWEIADRRLQNMGVVPAARQRYHRLWDVEAVVPEKPLTPGQMLKYLGMGLVDAVWVRAQLIALGVPGTQADVLIADAQLTRIGKQAKALDGLAKNWSARQRAIAVQARAIRQMQREAQAALSKSASPALLEKWLNAGIIDAPTYVSRATAIGIMPADALRVVAYVQQQQQAKIDKAMATADKPPKPAQPGGSPGVPRGVLTGWLKKGIITVSEFTSRMTVLGYSSDNITKWITQYAPAATQPNAGS